MDLDYMRLEKAMDVEVRTVGTGAVVATFTAYRNGFCQYVDPEGDAPWPEPDFRPLFYAWDTDAGSVLLTIGEDGVRRVHHAEVMGRSEYHGKPLMVPVKGGATLRYVPVRWVQ